MSAPIMKVLELSPRNIRVGFYLKTKPVAVEVNLTLERNLLASEEVMVTGEL